MRYECLLLNNQFVVAKPEGWAWSAKELADFDKHTTADLQPAAEDYSVDVKDGVSVMARVIDEDLILEQ